MLKKTFFVTSCLWLSFAQASNVAPFEILKIEKPSTLSFSETFIRQDILDVAMYEAGMLRPEDHQPDYHRYFLSHLQWGEDPSQYMFSCIRLDEAKDEFTEFLKEELQKLGVQNIDDIISKVFSSSRFKKPSDYIADTPSDLADFSTISKEDFTSIFEKDPYAGPFFRNVSSIVDLPEDQISQSDKGYIQSELKRINPLFKLVSPSHIPISGWSCRGNVVYYEGTKENSYIFRSFNFPNDVDLRIQWYQNNDLSIFTQTLLRAIYRTAQRIYNRSKAGDNIIIFGNTPYYIGRALNILMENKDKSRHVIEFPFSGSPNKVRPGSFPDNADIATPSRLNHLKRRLHEKGLLSSDFYSRGHTYIVDAIGSGGGIVYTLDTIVSSFDDHNISAQDILQNISLISLNKFYGLKEKNHNSSNLRHQSILGEKNLEDSEVGTLYLPSTTNPRYKIACEVMFTPGHGTLDMGVDVYPYLLRGFPKYNAEFWHSDFDFMLKQADLPNRKILMDHFDTNIKAYRDAYL